MSKRLYIGDSLGEGTSQYMPKSERDVRSGRTSTEGLRVLRSKLGRRHKAVIFDVGTNDATAKELKRNLKRAERLVGGRTLVVAGVNSPFREKQKNRVLQNFAKQHANVQLVPWDERDKLLTDGVHTNARGYKKRARMIRKASKKRAAMKVRKIGSPEPMTHLTPSSVEMGGKDALKRLLARGYSGR